MKKALIGLLCFLVAGAGVFFGIQYFTKTGVFKVPGVMSFSEDFPAEIRESIEEAFRETELEKDVNFTKNVGSSLRAQLSQITEVDDAFRVEFLYDIFVPVSDFYDTKNNVSSEEFSSGVVEKISVLELDEKKKLLSVDNEYFLDSFTTGGELVYLGVEAGDKADLEKIVETIKPELKTFPTKDTTLTFAQTGVTALSRGMNAKMNSVGTGAYFSENIGGFLSQFDLTHTSNEASFSGYATSANICSDERFIDTLTGIGLDIVELTGNHNLDCGDTAAIETIEKYESLGIKFVGGGRSAEEAAKQLEIAEKGNKITFLAYNQSTGGATYDDTPGANQYYEEDARTRIGEAKARGDTVIVDIQYYECNNYDYTTENTSCDAADSSAGDQIGLFRSLIDMGADIVVGTSAHQTQTYERYGEGEIYYGLGNLFFDQSWWPGTTRSLGLVHYFWNNKLVQTRRFGTVYDASYQTRLMNEEEEAWFINRLNQARP